MEGVSLGTVTSDDQCCVEACFQQIVKRSNQNVERFFLREAADRDDGRLFGIVRRTEVRADGVVAKVSQKPRRIQNRLVGAAVGASNNSGVQHDGTVRCVSFGHLKFR